MQFQRSRMHYLGSSPSDDGRRIRRESRPALQPKGAVMARVEGLEQLQTGNIEWVVRGVGSLAAPLMIIVGEQRMMCMSAGWKRKVVSC